jgi:hypothetical protein
MQQPTDLRHLRASEAQMVAYYVPGEFFLEDARLYRVNPRTDLDRLSVIDVADRARAERVIRSTIADRDRRHGDPPRLAPDLKFIHYLDADADAGYDVFVCSRRDCERVIQFRLEQNPRMACATHGSATLQQLAHVFVHATCGNLEQIRPLKCWNVVRGARCDTDLRLHIERADIGASYWWCPRCRSDGGHDQHALFKRCSACFRQSTDQAQEEGGQAAGNAQFRMWLVPASTAYKPQSVAALDMPQADEDSTLAEWIGSDGGEEELGELLKALPETARQNPVLVRELRQHVARERGGNQIPPLPEDSLQQLREFAGARSAGQPGVHLTQDQESVIARDFGLRADYLDGLAVLQMCFGYTLGTADPAQAKLMQFPLHGGRYGVLTRRQTTEGILLLLDTEQFLAWLGKDAPSGDAGKLREELLHLPKLHPALERTELLLHTVSHILIRTSERHSGVSRDRLREMILPRFGALLLYIDGGSELGMLRTTYEASMMPWLLGARENAQRCAYDPVCRESDIRACHACLYLGERSCNSFWNTRLDRLVLVGTNGTQVGYWG